MTSIDAILALAFMAMFVMALVAASAGVQRLVRGYSCRVLSRDQNASGPERGCIGQPDEVSATGIAAIRMANQSAFKALRDQLIAVGGGRLGPIAIDARGGSPPLISQSAQARHTELEQKCLWEKLAPVGSGDTFRAVRNHWRITPGSVSVVDLPLPAPSARTPGVPYWFIRSGRLVGEVMLPVDGLMEIEQVPGLQGMEERLLSIDPPSGGGEAISQAEADEIAAGGNVIKDAPDRQWGILNQVCLFAVPPSGSPIPNLYLLSGERGKDLGNNAKVSGEFLFGHELGVFSRQPQPRLLFYAPPPP